MAVMSDGGLFLIKVLFGLYSFVLLLRLILQWLGVNYYNPVAQFLVKVTQPVVKPFKSFLPRSQHLDYATLLVLLLFVLIKYALLVAMQTGQMGNILGLFVLASADIVAQILDIFFYAILAMVILSWLNPSLRSPIIEIIYILSQPIMRPVQRVIPPIAGFDLSPIPVLIGLKLISIVVVGTIFKLGFSLL